MTIKKSADESTAEAIDKGTSSENNTEVEEIAVDDTRAVNARTDTNSLVYFAELKILLAAAVAADHGGASTSELGPEWQVRAKSL